MFRVGAVALLVALVTATPAAAVGPVFNPGAQVATGDEPGEIVVTDFNQDGKLDVATADLGVSSLTVLQGNGDGTFASRPRPALTAPARDLIVADLNNDGKRDIVATTHEFPRVVEPLLGNGDGTFTAAPTYAEAGLFELTDGDFDGDGNRDLAVTLTAGSSNFVRPLQGAGDGTFTAKSVFNAFTSMNITERLIGARVDADAHDDLILDGGYGVRLSNGDFTFTLAPESRPRRPEFRVADVTGDGVVDIVGLSTPTGQTTARTLSTEAGSGSGAFTPIGDALPVEVRGPITVADLTADGVPDVVAPSSTGSQAVIFRGQTSGTFVPLLVVDLSAAAGAIAAADFDSDGDVDLAVTLPTSDKVSVLMRSTDATPPTVADNVVEDLNAENFQARLTAVDEQGGSGVKAIYYEEGLDPPVPSLASPTFDGIHTIPLSDGERIRYFAVDRAGNASAVQTSSRAQVDSVAPETTLVSGPPALTNNRTPQVGFSSPSANAARFECAQGTGGFAACTSPYAAPGQSDGAYEVRIRALNRASVPDPTPLVVVYTVDGTPPGAPTITAATTSLSFEQSEAASFECALDSAPAAPCTSPYALGPLGAGEHTFRVRAVDAAGNVGEPTTRTVIVPASTASRLKPRLDLPGRGRGRLFKKKYIAARITCGASCTIVLTGHAAVAGQRRFEIPVRRFAIGANGVRSFRIKTTKTQRRVLRRRHGKLVLEVVASGPGYQAALKTFRFRF